MKFGQFNLYIVRECTFKLDGGAMFGVVPKTLWEKVSPADELNRVPLACNLLLIETPHGRVLVETGMGIRWSEKEKERYALKPLIDGEAPLRSLGLSNEDIDFVIISHLHFDHCGGAVRLENGSLVPTYPKAKYYIQKGEWDLAHNANPRAKGSYRLDDFEPLAKAGCLTLIEGDSQVVPGVAVKVSGGHTGHHQVVTFSSGGERGVYFADIVPTRFHLPPPWVMGYDHFPLASCQIKSVLLETAHEEGWLVVFDHEMGVPWGRLRAAADKRFEFLALPEETLSFKLPVKSQS
ncbi:MAG: MBL fold metallo-hydrolase [Candidatus Melainabacteria bacterium]|nr:MAG: MBL fold metallo-hydrolase [Candidatus Melainabacteria bacterium]